MESRRSVCPRCGGTALASNGSFKGRAKYRCKTCRKTGYWDERLTARLQRYAQVEKLLAERLSLRAIVRTTGVSRMTVAKLLKKSGLRTSPDAGSLPGSGTR